MHQAPILQQASNISQFFFLIKNNIVAPKSKSYKYLKYRLLRPLLKGYYKLFNVFYPGRPWTTPASILFFDKVLTNDMVGLEYGSGRSTLYFASKLKKLVSIEHYEGWYNKVSRMIAQKQLSNVEYHLIPKQETAGALPDTEEALNTLKGGEERPEFAHYYNKVLEYPDAYFDFVLIDGRVREKCGLNAIAKLKPGGIFVLDNSERPRYHLLHEALQHWPKVVTTTGLTNTTIWIKP